MVMIRTLDDLEADGAAVGVRVDINSPLDPSGGLADDARLRAHVGTLSELLDRGARVAVLAHQGRPGGEAFTGLSAHTARLDELVEPPVRYCDATFSREAREAVERLPPGEAVVLENTRFYSEEYMEFDPVDAAETHLVDRLVPVFDAFVNDAFAAAHRSQPSLVGFPVRLPSYAGRVMERELAVLGDIGSTPRPRRYLLGGAKVGDSLDVARDALERGLADEILVCGIVGNAFLLADGVGLGAASAAVVNGRSSDAVRRAGELLDRYPDRIRLPVDVAVEAGGGRHELGLAELPSEGAAMDIGERTMAAFVEAIEESGTVVLNGPAGVFEEEAFIDGTVAVYRAATRAGYSIVGGGDTAAALRSLGIDGFDHLSTGGGACLNMLTGDPLPAVQALEA
jgi:phosphoglycerate kinase